MNIVYTIDAVREQVKAWKQAGLSVGYVPTMGFLHEGHASLMKQARQDNDKVVVSIFVNPTQFGPTEDLDSYPRDLDHDSDLCESMGVDLIFHPEPSEMYVDPKAYVNIVGLSDHLCGATRPIHFKGVCTVVSKFFNIVTPDRAYFGQKDAQQLAIIRKMVCDLNIPVTIVGVPIVREQDGLAKSSRNTYLNDAERKAATVLYKSVLSGQTYLQEQAKTSPNIVVSSQSVLDVMTAVINEEPLAKIDYVSVVDALTMEPVETIDRDVLVAMAVYIGKTRLIDNFSYAVDRAGNAQEMSIHGATNTVNANDEQAVNASVNK